MRLKRIKSPKTACFYVVIKSYYLVSLLTIEQEEKNHHLMTSTDSFYKSKVTARYQISIPKEVREKLGLKEGDYVTFRENNGYIIIGRGEFVVSEKCKR